MGDNAFLQRSPGCGGGICSARGGTPRMPALFKSPEEQRQAQLPATSSHRRHRQQQQQQPHRVHSGQAQRSLFSPGAAFSPQRGSPLALPALGAGAGAGSSAAKASRQAPAAGAHQPAGRNLVAVQAAALTSLDKYLAQVGCFRIAVPALAHCRLLLVSSAA
jgi:hypothetical protein